MPADSVPDENFIPGLQTAAFSQSSLDRGWGEGADRELWFLLMRTLITSGWGSLTLIISSKPNYPPQPPNYHPPNNIPFEVRASAYEFEGTQAFSP